MIKKIIHFSDLHIRTYQLHPQYKKQFKLLISDIKKQIGDLDFNECRIVITGDIVHSKINISNEQILLTSWLFNELSSYCPLIIIPGNHDFLENNTMRIDSITPIIELMNNENIKYYKDYGVYTDENINWVVYSLYQFNERPEIEKINDNINVGLFHGQIQGLKTDLGFEFQDGYDKTNFHGCDIVLCGDIHLRQVIYLNKEIEVDEDELDLYLKNGWEKL